MQLPALSALAVGSLIVLAACAEAPPPRAPSPAGLDQASLRLPCPLGVPGTLVHFDETATGAKLTFTTTPAHLTDLRWRARDAAAMHGTGQHVGRGHGGKHGWGAGRHGIRPTQLPRAYAGVEDTEDGARMIITPTDPNDLETLRAKLKQRVERMMTSCD